MAFRSVGAKSHATRVGPHDRAKAATSTSLPIPGRPTDVTPSWLSAALSAGGEPVQVTDVDVVPVGTGQTGATYRIAATYAANPAGLPDTFVIKLPVQDDAVKGGVTLGYLSGRVLRQGGRQDGCPDAEVLLLRHRQ